MNIDIKAHFMYYICYGLYVPFIQKESLHEFAKNVRGTIEVKPGEMSELVEGARLEIV
jgi:hypothetical protein